MWILHWTLQLALGLAVRSQLLPEANNMCSEGSCYPATGDLLIGRAHRLTASSTCGIYSPERFCIVSSLATTKCLDCDSRDLYNEVTHPNSHTIDNVVTTFTPNRLVTWWQSENGVENVTIQLDLEAEFHFTHIIMTFKTFRPAAMVIERSSDFGQTWKVYSYFAFNCSASFPHVSQGPVKSVDEVICDSRYSNIEPSTEGEVIFRALDPAFKIPDPYSQRIQNLLRITNLRVRMVKLHTLGDNLLDGGDEVTQKYYYALYDMVVRGNCFCYGHSSECAPLEDGEAGPEGMVHGRCVCNHHTAGLNCERCRHFYHDTPWRPAEGRNTNECKKCECNQHSYACQFNMAMYVASGNVSGGVCDDCQHNTQGQHCEGCKPFYYQHPNRDIRDPHVCERCDCDAWGSLNKGECDSLTDVMRGLIAGQCRCKQNVEGERCDHCKRGYYGLSQDVLGCLPCSCNPLGTLPGGNPCDTDTGICYCKRLVTGRNCDRCQPQHWGLSADKDGCRPCDCDLGGALNNDCSPQTGQCVCREHMSGRRCNTLRPGYYFTALDHYTYEAEEAAFGPAVTVVMRPIPRPTDGRPTWTGLGFARVPERESLRFTIDNIPQSMDYDLLIRYEPQLPEVWERLRVDVKRPAYSSVSAHCPVSNSDHQTISLPPGSRYMVLPRPLCFEKGQKYTVNLNLAHFSPNDFHHQPHIFIDSIVLLPVVQDLELFSGSADGETAWEMFQKYRCLENSKSVQKLPMNDICRDYIFTASALLHQGAMECECDQLGSSSTLCDPNGGQCSCKENVVGRKCNSCAPGTFQLGPSGCRSCECDPLGSKNPFCNSTTGQCLCLPGVYGRHCAQCLPRHWGFPHCRQCFCNGHGEQCHPLTGQCLECTDHTTGDQCERCKKGYHGNALLGSSERCRPCMCPDGPDTGRQFADTCYQNPTSLQFVCVCSQGYKGPRCEDCAPGYYGNPKVTGGWCRPCQCNGNINMHDPMSCDARSGACLRCLHNTEGRACQHCRRGYYGDASSQSCQKCMCQLLGTDSSRCVDGECECGQGNGQCPCLPNVEGLRCDHCAPNTWNFYSGEGCQPCQCHPTHSYSQSCDVISGQCVCMPGFGGRTCDECRPLFWGDPEVKCLACDCDPRGTVTPQCNKTSGACVCVEGAGGHRCDSCGRGYMGTFPDCRPCHQCFREWNVTVGELTNQTQHLVDTVEDLKVTGVTAAYQETIDNLEGGAKQIAQILEDDKAQQTLRHSQELAQQAKRIITELDRSVNRSEVDVKQISKAHGRIAEELSTLSVETQKQQESFHNTQQKVLRAKHSDPAGAVDSIREYYQETVEAESQVFRTTTDPHSLLEQSVRQRQATEHRLQAEKEQFNYKQGLDSDILNKLNQVLEQDDLSQLSEKVCGGRWSPDGCGECGGLGCVGEDGKHHCGGQDCKGVLTQTNNEWKKAKDLDKDITDSQKEVEKLQRMVSSAQGRADESKISAQQILLKANQNKARVERTNQELRELIQQIRDFLTNGTDLARIEALSDEVLKMKMPVVVGELKNVTSEIRQHVAGLTGVDEVLAQSAEQAQTAERLLQQARHISEETTQLREEVDTVKVALNESEHAQSAANDSLNAAKSDIDYIKQQIKTVETKTAESEFMVSNATQRLLDLEEKVDAVQQKTRESLNNAKSAEDGVEYASENTEQTKRKVDLEVQPKFQSVRGLMEEKAFGVSDAQQRAERLREEAKNLVADVITKLRNLSEVERIFFMNQKTLAERAAAVEELEKEAQAVLQDLSQRVTVYSTCL